MVPCSECPTLSNLSSGRGWLSPTLYTASMYQAYRTPGCSLRCWTSPLCSHLSTYYCVALFLTQCPSFPVPQCPIYVPGVNVSYCFKQSKQAPCREASWSKKRGKARAIHNIHTIHDHSNHSTCKTKLYLSSTTIETFKSIHHHSTPFTAIQHHSQPFSIIQEYP